MIAWNGSRETVRALAEAMPARHKTDQVVVVIGEHPTEEEAIMDIDAVDHLRHHGIHPDPHRIKSHPNDVGNRLMDEAGRRRAASSSWACSHALSGVTLQPYA